MHKWGGVPVLQMHGGEGSPLTCCDIMTGKERKYSITGRGPHNHMKQAQLTPKAEPESPLLQRGNFFVFVTDNSLGALARDVFLESSCSNNKSRLPNSSEYFPLGCCAPGFFGQFGSCVLRRPTGARHRWRPFRFLI